MSKIAFVFPGQGSQAVGMLSDYAESYPSVLETFSEASDALGYDLWDLVQNDPSDQLNQTEFTQPALLTASVAVWRVAQESGLGKPDVVAGHSLGEYSALVAADVLAFADAVKLVQQRGQFMQTAVPLGQGGMAAVLGLDDETVREICNAASTGQEIVQAANYNAPGQVVIAGSNSALELAIEKLKEAGAKRAMPLAVSAPFHSEMMKPAADRMADALSAIQISAPSIQVVQNVDAGYHSEPEQIRQNLVSQMSSAVLWTETVQTLSSDGVTTLIECGPGKVLAGLTKRIDKSLQSMGLNTVDALQTAKESIG